MQALTLGASDHINVISLSDTQPASGESGAAAVVGAVAAGPLGLVTGAAAAPIFKGGLAVASFDLARACLTFVTLTVVEDLASVLTFL